MKIISGYDDAIQFSGFGSAHAVSSDPPAKPKKTKRAKFKVGFAIPKKPKAERVKA